MDVDEYRKNYLQQLKEQEARPEKGALNEWREAVYDEAGLESTGDDEGSDVITGALDTLTRDGTSAEERREALKLLKAARFSTARFAPYEERFRAALRTLTSDEDGEIRRIALESLAALDDSYALDLVATSLAGPDEALLPDITAIQILGQSAHGDYVPLVREVAARDLPPETFAEALRVLAADPESEEMFRGYLKDKEAPRYVRRISARALQALNPDAFREEAREIVADNSEDDVLRATCLSALAHADPSAEPDDELAGCAAELADTAESEDLKNTARQYVRSKGPDSESTDTDE